MIISIEYRINSHRGVQFRLWATQVLKEYMIKVYTLSIDYDPRTKATHRIFKTVQNKMHFSAHDHTAAEVIFQRAVAERDFIGLTTCRGAIPTNSLSLSI